MAVATAKPTRAAMMTPIFIRPSRLG
jgi:hypothetical protein